MRVTRRVGGTMDELAQAVNRAIREVPDFPRPGILFKDITPVLADAKLFRRALDWMATDAPPVDRIVAMESRGFLFAAGLVDRLGAGLVPARKLGHLPHETVRTDYHLEYGSGTLEIHTDAIRPGMRVLVVDDLLATGGTAVAAIDLIQRLGGQVVGATFLIELGFLAGRARLGVPVRSLVVC